jgi:pseudouridine-5'-phosphate glycosidase
VFATGGIGGVHRGWQKQLDVSADLYEIARTPLCVVSSGSKSILDLPTTIEMLEALGVPVVGWRTNTFPQFFSSGTDELRIDRRVDSIADAAALCDMQWNTLGRREGILLCNPPPDEFAVNANEVESAIEQAEAAAQDQGIRGAARTPFLLAELARLTNGRTLDANLMLLLNNARLAAELACALAARQTHGR